MDFSFNLSSPMDQSIAPSKKHGLIRSKENYRPANKNAAIFSDETLKTIMDYDTSLTMAPNEIRRFMDNSTMAGSKAGTTFNNKSYFIQSETMVSGGAADTLTAQEKSDLLYGHFLEILQSRTNDSEIFDTVQDLIQACTDTIDEIAKQERRTKSQQVNLGDFSWLEQERDTWRLLYALYKDRLIVQKEATDYDDLPLLGSERAIIEHLYTNNANLREYQLIVDWLEQSALERGTPQIGHYTDRTVSWENTLHQLQNVNQSVFGSSREIVKSLDPDAPYREKKPLHDLDTEDQARLSRQILTEMRKGRIEDAQSLCEHCGQPWRAALLEGWRLYNDPNYETNEPDLKVAIEGNPRRDLWKKLAWMMAENVTLEEYNRAYIGLLCGHLESVLIPLSSSWIDMFWAYLKVQIDIRVESEIRSCSTRNYMPMPEKYWNGKMSLEQIFDELNAHKSSSVRAAADNPVNIIQKYLILDDIPAMMKHIDTWITGSKVDTQMLRFLTHVVLFMRQVGRQHQEDIADKVIKTYVEGLIELGENQLVAFYTAAVPQDQQIILYSKYLKTINTTADRQAALEEAVSVGLDVHEITCYTVESVRGQVCDQNEPKPLQGTISPLDEEKISILEWLTFYPQQKGELLWQTNAMIRTFLAENKIECVRKAFKMVPIDAIQQIIQNYGGKDNLPMKEECSIKEYLCHQTYLGAIDSYNDWTRLYHSKPKEPQAVSANANFTERIASEHREQAFKTEIERWQNALVEQTRITRELLYNILLFPDKGYLVDPDFDAAIDEEVAEAWEHRQVQMINLRKLCIPETVLLLHKVLHLAEDYRECVRLADELASEQRQLYTVFSKHKLAEIIGKISESSLALMNEKLDPWGYSLAS